MKKKLFYLLVALLAVTGFQAKAADGVLAWIATGDSVTSRPTNDFNGEKWGYNRDLFLLNQVPSKLTYKGNAFVYVDYNKDATDKSVATTAGSPDRIYVSNPSANQIKFSTDKAGNNPLTLTYDKTGVTYTTFSVFMAATYPYGLQNANLADDPSYDGLAARDITYQDFNEGNFRGFLSVNTVNKRADDSNLIIVVHDKNGKLSLISYGDYIQKGFLLNGLYPLFVKSNPVGGRWATPDDFINCNDFTFTFTDPDTGAKSTLSAFAANLTPTDSVALRGSTVPYSRFNVQQVDYVSDGNNNPHNIIGTASFQGKGKDWGGTNPWNYGTTTTGITDVIPLFRLVATGSNGQVLSVSRQNDWNTQAQNYGVVANKVEVRKYETVWEYVTVNGKLTYLEQPKLTCNDANYYAYTSLQKFAIWIDEDGNMQLYPAASYFWNYGNSNYKKTDPTVVKPNAVLTYNDVDVNTVGKPGDPVYGTQIGWWDGLNSTPNGQAVAPYIATSPNWLLSSTNYYARPWVKDCADVTPDITGRFFFLTVKGVTEPTGSDPGAADFKDKAYQSGREYVLATQPNFDPLYPNTKRLVLVPKEIVMSDTTINKDYWRLPYDSVNMAAHWEIQPIDKDNPTNGYLLINELSDTLQFNYNFDPGVTAAQNAAALNGLFLSGGYVPVNSFMPGSSDPNFNDNNYPAVEKYFGRPTDIGLAWDNVDHWFPLNAVGSFTHTATPQYTWNTWKFIGSRINGSLSLEVPDGFSANLKLTGWENNHNTIGVANGSTKTAYWQQGVVLDVADDGLKTYDCSQTIPSTSSGLTISIDTIKYVPDNGVYYPGAKKGSDKISNSCDPDFFKQDSLMAYSFLEGNFDVQEALAVNNDLTLGSISLDINDGKGTRVDVARFVNQDANALQFIPLNSATGMDRRALINSTLGRAANDVNNIDLLFGETYKWYLVKLGDKYMTFDTVNVAAGTPDRFKVGLVFSADLANATPVRLYQPLVGDKQNDNFLFQFYMPLLTYYTGGTATPTYGRNVFPSLEPGTPTQGGGEVCFATLAGQSNYIFGMRAFTGTASGVITPTRFHLKFNSAVEQCIPNFIDPQWMGEQRLLNLPLFNELWEKGAPVQPTGAWIADGSTNKVVNSPAAIVTNAGSTKATTLLHTYVTTIQTYSDDAGYAKVSISGTSTAIGTTWVGGTKNSPLKVGSAIQNGWSFERDLPVPLYTVQNTEGLYLTVIPDDDMTTLEGATVPDVNGVKLAWLPKYDFATSALRQAAVDSLGYDIRALQLFAISGCVKDPVDNKYGEFVYLPLASYQYDYSNNKIITTPALKRNAAGKFDDVNAVFYNEHLGKSMGYAGGNDLRDCWRISQYMSTGGLEKNLVVFNSNNAQTAGNMTPIQVKWTKDGYIKPECDYFLVKQVDYTGKGKYIDIQNANLTTANENTLFAHWKAVADANDEDLFTFAPEIQKVYDKEVGVGKAYPQTQLKGQYYFVTKIKVGANKDIDAYRAIDVSGYATGNFNPVFDTLQLICTNHDLPFFDLAKAGYDLTSPIAIVESFECDRTMDMINVDYPKGIEDRDANNKLAGFRLLIRLITDRTGFSDAKYVNVYAENRRELTPLVAGDETHVIPYYAFSIKDGNKEYFLNVDPSKDYKINWDTITAAQLEILKAPDVAANQNAMKYFKFCFPYKTMADSTLAAPACNGQQPVHMQTLDTAIDDYPWLVNSSLVTGLTTANQLQTAISGDPTTNSLKANIYTVDYSKIDQSKANAWVFNGKQTGEQIWVPIDGLVVNDSISKTRDGALTSYSNGSATGTMFITKAADPDTFGMLMGSNIANNVTLVYGGRSMIGDWTKRPIWYYRIMLGDQYLTDATVVDPTNTLTAQGATFPVAYFTDLIKSEPAYAQHPPLDSVIADKGFNQTFGFLYATSSDDPDQPFYIVSNANAFDTNLKSKDFRYLAQVNEHLVFVTGDNPVDANALVFQWGKLDEDGYTKLQVVGTANIYGVDGGIKCVNTTGKVDIYSIDGRLIKSAVLTGSDQTIAAPRGIAIVKNGSTVVKVVIR